MRKERALDIVHRLRKMYPKSHCSLAFKNAYQLLIATMLSAQATDARVNEVTKDLFKKYPAPADLAHAKQSELEQQIRSTGYYRQKAKSIVATSQAIVKEHAGKVPSTMEELIELPGVGRKTANVVLSNAFNAPVGIVVDTHVTRVAGRLGLTQNSDAAKIEEDLMKLIPKEEWTSFSHRVIDHGRAICVARKPKCSECMLNEVCPSAEAPLE